MSSLLAGNIRRKQLELEHCGSERSERANGTSKFPFNFTVRPVLRTSVPTENKQQYSATLLQSCAFRKRESAKVHPFVQKKLESSPEVSNLILLFVDCHLAPVDPKYRRRRTIIAEGGPWDHLFCCRKRLNFAPKRPLRAQRKK